MIPSTLLRTISVYRTWGTPWQRLGCGFWLGQPGYAEQHHRTDYWALGLVLRGSGEFNGQKLTPGCAFVRHPGVVHDFSVAEGYAECWLDLGGALAGIPMQFGLTDPAQAVFVPGLDLALIRRWHALVVRAEAASDRELPVLGGEVMAILASLIEASQRRQNDAHAELLDEAAKLLTSGAGRPVLERLARRHGLSFERFRKLFQQRTGIAPGAYRMSRRMDRARELLRDGTLTVAEVAAAIGCASTATFSLQFKAHAGVAPDTWRRGLK